MYYANHYVPNADKINSVDDIVTILTAMNVGFDQPSEEVKALCDYVEKAGGTIVEEVGSVEAKAESGQGTKIVEDPASQDQIDEAKQVTVKTYDDLAMAAKVELAEDMKAEFPDDPKAVAEAKKPKK